MNDADKPSRIAVPRYDLLEVHSFHDITLAHHDTNGYRVFTHGQDGTFQQGNPSNALLVPALHAAYNTVLNTGTRLR